MPTSPFGLSENPFVEGHDARFVYPSRAHLEVVARLRRGIESREPFVLVTGLSGAGKTVALRAALAETEPHTLVMIAASPSLSPAKFRERILSGFSADAPAPATQARSAAGIEARLRAIHARGGMAFLVVDEAQNLGLPLLEELRVLSDLEADGHNLLQIVLAGQPRLEDELSRPGGDALRQRIAVRCRLGLLSPEETESYIRHRVSVAGGDPESLFTSESCEAVHRLTHGIPREINLLAGEALTLAHTAGEDEITAGHIAGAAVLLGFRSVVRDSGPARDSTKPVAVQPVEVVSAIGTDPGRGECEEPAMGLCGLPDVILPQTCEAPPLEHADEPGLVDIVPFVPAPPESAPAPRAPEPFADEAENVAPAPPESAPAPRAPEPFADEAENVAPAPPERAPAPCPPASSGVEAENVAPAPSDIPLPAPRRPLGPAAKATPASLESPEVDAWLARFRGPDGPPRIGSRLAVATTASEALESRCAGATDDEPAVGPPPRHGVARKEGRPRRRAPRGRRRWSTMTSMAGALLLVAVGGLVLVTSGRSVVRTRPSARPASMSARPTVSRLRTTSPPVARPLVLPVARPPVVPAAPAAAPARASASAAPALARAPAAASPAPAPPARRYGVEVATFILESRAVEERDRIAARTSLPCRIVSSRQDGAEVYSLVVGPVASPEEAVLLTEDLTARRLVDQARVVRWAASDSPHR
jgi:type II secretory pathway predicted ATPase ExeA